MVPSEEISTRFVVQCEQPHGDAKIIQHCEVSGHKLRCMAKGLIADLVRADAAAPNVGRIMSPLVRRPSPAGSTSPAQEKMAASSAEVLPVPDLRH